MGQLIAMVSVLVADYDEAIAYYTRALRFTVVEDKPQGPSKRWVVLAPPGQAAVGAAGQGARLLLAQAANDRQRARVGDQAGGRVWLFLHTDDFWGDYRRLPAYASPRRAFCPSAATGAVWHGGGL